MAYIKDYKDRLFLGRIAIHPERLSEASEDAQSISVEPDGTLVLGEGGGEEPTAVTWDDIEDKPDFGTASEADVEDFATSAQGELADSAVQPGDLSTVATSGDYGDLSNTPTLGTAAAADIGDFATAAQGTLADSAVQSADVAALVTSYLEGLAG